MLKLRIGIIGCGAIGSSLGRVISSDLAKKAQLCGLYDINRESAFKLAVKAGNAKLVVPDLKALIKKSDLVIEATKADAAFDIAKQVISSSKDIMIMSAGGVINRYKELAILAEKKKARIFIPSGAICGIDGLKALSCAKIRKVTLTTKKPPEAFAGVSYIRNKNIKLDGITDDTVIFEGSAESAVLAFPQNINVASTLSMAGIGAKSTVVRIIASPNIKRNIHEVEIDSDAGKIIARTENVIHPDNPKTSFLAVLSAIAALKGILSPIKIGT
jgi:aspartate dehydrogenase